MKIKNTTIKLSVLAIFILLILPIELNAQTDTTNTKTKFGVKFRAGGRYDDVRMCVASPAGATGGTAADISIFMEFYASQKSVIHIDVPVFRPILFGFAFEMLQFEPTVALKYSKPLSSKTNFKTGPLIGVSLHYGPDYNSEAENPGRTDSFFAMGPIVGGYIGFEFKNPNKKRSIEIGITPYAETLFGINDPENHKGYVFGGLIDLTINLN
jgi:hypothetical protein